MSSEDKKDFSYSIPIKKEDIIAFAKEGVELPEGFEHAYLEKDFRYRRKNSFENEEVDYRIMIAQKDGKTNVGTVGIQKWFDIEVGGEIIEDCWARHVEMEKFHGVSYGQMGITRAAIKTLMQEMKNMDIKNVCAFVMKENEASLKMGKEVGWKDAIIDYKDNGKQADEKSSYLFYAPVSEIVDFLDNRAKNTEKETTKPSLKHYQDKYRGIEQDAPKVPLQSQEQNKEINPNGLKMDIERLKAMRGGR